MNICGIVVEYNPFHNGHLHHLQEAKKITNADIVIAIMSPTFMQRGEPAIIDKFTRTKTILDYGIDIVVELPSVYAIQSANYFAKGSISILNKLQVNHLVFGSESNDLDKLIKLAKTSLIDEYQDLVKKYMLDGQRYAVACNMAFSNYGFNKVDTSNDILGLAYLQEIYSNNYDIKPHSIQRTNDFLSNEINSDIASATAIRSALYNKIDISKTTVMKELNNSNKLVFIDDFYDLLKYKLNTTNLDELKEIHGMTEGIESLLLKHINESNDIHDFINKISNKRYPKTRVQRLIIHTLANIKAHEIKEAYSIDYIRILGMSTKGQEYLKQIDIDDKIITSFARHKHLALDLEHRFTKLYALANKNNEYLIKKEYQEPVIIKKEI